MLSKAKAGEIMQSMLGLIGFPSNAVAQDKLVKAFRQADTEQVASSAISNWVSESSKCPTPQQIAAIIDTLNMEHRDKIKVSTARCIECSGTGFVITHGINRFDGLIVTGTKPCICRSMGQPVVEDRDACSKCGGHGLYGGHIGTDHDGPWIACLCPAGRTENAQLRVAEGNAARDKIIAIGDRALRNVMGIPRAHSGRNRAEDPMTRAASIVAQLAYADDDYHGDF